ncbi:MAG: mechanosensitive ion channel family protein [Verrucomicrobiales bacterium]|nr:mechanosensitive ion channel family protein [Verrucomicrobiales bacterium]
MSENTNPAPAQGVAAVNEQASALSDHLSQWLHSQSWVAQELEKPSALLILGMGLVLCSSLLYFIVRPLLLRWMHLVTKRTKFSWDDLLFGHGVFRWSTHFFPALFIYLITPGLFKDSPILIAIVLSAALIYMVIVGYLTIDSLLNVMNTYYRRRRSSQRFIVGTFIQVIKLFTAIVAIVLIIAILIGKPPLLLLGGLGMFASVLMLVFKDVILGFVAGIQIASNKMLTPGNWLEMPSHGADGTVEEIGLTVVKVRNFDNTVTTLPTYTLISQPFKNWQGMTDSGGRRIKRSLLIDINTIRLADPAMLERFREIEHIGDYLEKKESEIAEWNQQHAASRHQNRVNGRRLTNVGTFRAYIEAYLKNHPDIHQHSMTLLVRQLSPNAEGLPIEIYCFTTTTDWIAYESIQADIFDHLLAVASEFDLHIFQQSSGTDIRAAIAELSPQK